MNVAEAIVFREDYERHNRLYFLDAPNSHFTPYRWQREFFAAGKTHPQRLLMAANRVGKTLYGGCYELSCHLTGWYPDWWEGRRFDHPILAWALGVSGEQIRDVLQKALLGEAISSTEFTLDGMLPRESFIDATPAQGTPRLAKDIRVSYKGGGRSVLSQKSYSQGQHALMGGDVDFILIDEEPVDPTIYPQCLARTATSDKGKGGAVAMTFTPENGMTLLVTQFMEDIKPGQYLQMVTWEDAPHLDEETKKQLYDAFPEYQREMRSKGIPVLGEGLVFPIADTVIMCEPFEIPAHFARLAAIDLGYSHPTAVVWAAYDADRDIIYLTDEYRKSGEVPAIHAAAIKSRGTMPLVYPHDGDNTEKGSGETMISLYGEAGLTDLLKFQNEDGTRFVEPGIQHMLERMRTGRLKVFSNLYGWLSEFRRYHRKNGKIVKQDDDLIDASRYAALMVARHGVRAGEATWGRWKADINQDFRESLYG